MSCRSFSLLTSLKQASLLTMLFSSLTLASTLQRTVALNQISREMPYVLYKPEKNKLNPWYINVSIQCNVLWNACKVTELPRV